MVREYRGRLLALSASVALVAVLVPGGPATGTHDAVTDGDFADGSMGVLRLHLDSDGDFFTWTDQVTDATTTTALITYQQDFTSTRCQIALTGDALVTFDEPGSGTTDRGPGYKDHGTGVKSGGSQGVACSRVSGSEVLHMSITEGLLAGLEIAEAQLDIEVKRGAEVELTTFFGEEVLETFILRSGSSIVPGEGTDPPPDLDYLATSTALDPIANCASRSDSGPDAGAADNCRWVLKDLTPFTGMTMRALNGEFTLEGGHDGTPPAMTGISTFGTDSLFFLTDIDVLDCGDTVSVGDALTDPEGVFTRLNFFTTPECVLKPYTISATFVAGSNQVEFVPQGEVDAKYSARLTSVPYPSENPVGQTLQYDRDGDGSAFSLEVMAWRLTADIVYDTDGNGDVIVDPTTGLVERTITAATLPGTHSWCIADMETRVGDGTIAGFDAGEIQTSWWVYGEDDPNFDFK